MRKQWVTLLMALFVTIQFVDLAILDSLPQLTPTVDQVSESKPNLEKMGLDCAISCTCQSLHSMWLASYDGVCGIVSLASPPTAAAAQSLKAVPSGPPVPPPNA